MVRTAQQAFPDLSDKTDKLGGGAVRSRGGGLLSASVFVALASSVLLAAVVTLGISMLGATSPDRAPRLMKGQAASVVVPGVAPTSAPARPRAKHTSSASDTPSTTSYSGSTSTATSGTATTSTSGATSTATKSSTSSTSTQTASSTTTTSTRSVSPSPSPTPTHGNGNGNSTSSPGHKKK